jgi:hypothetical protein
MHWGTPVFLFGAAIIFVWLREKVEDEEWESDDEPEEPPYEQSYPLDTAELPETATNLLAQRVEDATPDGRVVMRLQEGVFEYWADKTVAYKYLEAVARKYVIVYNRRSEYVNMFRELLKALNEPPPPPKPVDKVFAALRPVKVQKGLVNEKANRYHWMGRLAELDPPPPREMPKAIRYTDYKKKV